MVTVADTFDRSNTSQGTLGSTDTGSLAWQNPTYWLIDTNAAKNTEASDVAWVITPNPDADVKIVTGNASAFGNGVGAAFWVEDNQNYWDAYVYSERYTHHQDCANECVGGYYTCQSCEFCGGGNTNPVTYTAGETTTYVGTVACGCSANSHGTCECTGPTPSRSTGNVTETANVCGDANCSSLSGNNAETCTTAYDYNPVYYNPVVPGTSFQSGGGTYKSGGNVNATNYNAITYNKIYYNSPTFTPASGGNCKAYSKTYRECTSFNPYTPSKYTPGNYATGGYQSGGGTYASGGNTNATVYNAKTYSYNAPTGGNESGGNKFTYYFCAAGTYESGACLPDPCTPVSNAGSYCSGAGCAGDSKTCTSCGTTGKQYSRTCTCTQTGGNVNACSTCANCYDACLTTQEVCTDVYYRRYYLKVDRVAGGTRTNHWTSTALYDGTSATEVWGSLSVATSGSNYTATVYTDGAWTSQAATSGSQASGQTDYLSSVGHGIAVEPLGLASPGGTDSVNQFVLEYAQLGGDSVGVMIG